ncbi:hypothetical protein [Cellulosimicrobium sp. 22601]|uniref:hypothetical protein n=1 Tax=unclassified Cellulosimicrobium TaxID=2624466 RepID=UPI003F83EEF2
MGANISWANTEDRTARTAPARRALEARFLAEAGGDPKRAENLRRAHFQRLALKSARARRRARELAEKADALSSASVVAACSAEAADAEARAAEAELADPDAVIGGR